ncbi:unnamed protein product, partial [marine sediment metagenome]
MRLKIAVYSAITGGYEPYRHNQNKNGAKFFMFSDRYEDSWTWQFYPSTKLFVDPRRNARYHKILPHEYFDDYDVTCWIDGSMEVKASLPYLIETWLPGYDCVVFKHPDRTCVYDEATVVKGKGYDHADVIDRQMAKYKDEGYPKNNGLSETKIVMRYNTPEITKFNKLWFYELTTGSLRDQLSFDYCAWKTGLKVNRVPPMQEGQKGFVYYKHAKKEKKRIQLGSYPFQLIAA